MATQYDIPISSQIYSEQDQNLFNKLPYYLAAMTVRRQPLYNTFDKLFGKILWKPNMGTTMKGVEAVNTPIGRQMFYPNPITTTPNKDVFTNTERTEQCNVLSHRFESKIIPFLGSFQDFRTNQLDFQHDDIVRQIGVGNDQFIRSVIFQKSPIVYIVANTAPDAVQIGNPELAAAPYIPAGTDITAATVAAAGKNAAWLIAAAAKVGSPGLKYTTIDRMVMTMRDDLGAAPFEGVQNSPKDNELIKGKYVFVSSSEAFQNLKWDPNLGKFRSETWNIYQDGFRGSPFDEVVWKSEIFPLRMLEDGTFPVPQIQTPDGDTVVNPTYATAKYEWAFLIGADSYKTIKIGPPPKDFASGSMSVEKFNGMQWNGEVRLTRNVLVQYADNSIDTNKYGEFLQLIASLTMGCLPTRARNCIPVLFERQRPATQQVG